MKAVFPRAVSHTTVHNLSKKLANSHIEEEEYEVEDGGIWLRASMPALYGPHSDRPWVQILRALIHRDNGGVTHASHPESQPTNP